MEDFATMYRGLSPVEKQELAKRIGSSLAYLSQLVNGHRRASALFAVKIEHATDGKIRRQDIRPDIFCHQIGSND